MSKGLHALLFDASLDALDCYDAPQLSMLYMPSRIFDFLARRHRAFSFILSNTHGYDCASRGHGVDAFRQATDLVSATFDIGAMPRDMKAAAHCRCSADSLRRVYMMPRDLFIIDYLMSTFLYRRYDCFCLIFLDFAVSAYMPHYAAFLLLS